MAAAFSIQSAISLNAFAGLLLLLPAIAFTPLPWKPLNQVESEPALDSETAPEPAAGEA